MSQHINTEVPEKLLRESAVLAKQWQHEYITVTHLLFALLNDPKIVEIVKDFNVDIDILRKKVVHVLDNEMEKVVTGRVAKMQSRELILVIQDSVNQVLMSGRSTVEVHDMLLSIAKGDPSVDWAVYLLHSAGITDTELKEYITQTLNDEPEVDGFDPRSFAAGMPGASGTANKAAKKKPMTEKQAIAILEQYTVNLNKKAEEAKIDPLIGREDEVMQVALILSRRTKNNAVIVGEPGVGKTAIAEGLAKLIIEKKIPAALQESTVYALDVGSLVAGTKYRGDFEERMKQVLEAVEFSKDPILFIDEIHTIMGAGAAGGGNMDMSNLLKPALQKGKLRCIGSTTADEFRKYFEKDRALLRRFARIDVFEPSIEDAKKIIKGIANYYENFHKVKYTNEALDAAVELSSRYIQNRFLPDKAIDLIDQAGARQKINDENRKELIEAIDIEYEVSKIAKIPQKTVTSNENQKLASLETDLLNVVFGQETAIQTLIDAVYMARAGLREANKPMGSYLFVGPTGVGKTEAAKQLAKTLGVPFLRYDMSEYMEKHSVSKLIGAPPGYVGYAEGNTGSGKLINDIETHSHAVLLLDEIEKAHPDVYNILLQVMDDGKLSSSSGKTVNFQNIILIMTSNAGATEAEKESIGFNRTPTSKTDEMEKAVKLQFAPEFRNRLDAIVQFKNLTKDNIALIINKFMIELNTLSRDRGIFVELTDNAKQWLIDSGYDPKMGARPLKRLIQDKINKPLAKEILFGKLVNGGHVVFDYKKETDSFEWELKKEQLEAVIVTE